MLGRTNVMQRKEPTINGEVKNFVVASGNTIAKGDFVSYKLQTDKIDLDSLVRVQHKYYGSNLYVNLYYQTINEVTTYYLELVDVSTGVDFLDGVTFTSRPVYNIDENGNIFVGCETSFYLYKIEDRLFSLKDVVTTSRTIAGVCKADENGTYVLITKDFKTRPWTDLYGQIITVASNQINLSVEVLIKENISTYEATTYLGCEYVSQGYFVCVWGYPYVSNNSGTVYCLMMKYENGSYTTNLKSLYYLSSSSNKFLGVEFIGELVYVKSTNRNELYYILNDDFVVLRSIANMYGVSDNYLIQHWSSNNVNSYVLYKWDGETSTLINGATYTLNSSEDVITASMFYLKGQNQIIKNGIGEAVIFTFDVETLEISKGYFSNVVEEYSGNYTVGFAKTGGNSGDTIQVYVPQISS